MEDLDFEGILRESLDNVEEPEIDDEEIDEEYEDEDEYEDDDQDEEEYDDEEDDELDLDEDDEDEDIEEEEEYEEDFEDEDISAKKPQSREENARFAQMRREQQLQQQVEEAKKNSVEYKTAKALADMYGITVEELYSQIEERQLEQQAEEQGVSVEYIKKLRETEQKQQQTQQELEDLRFQLWSSRVDNEANGIQKEYPMLTNDDIFEAKTYLLKTIGNPDMPLEQAIFALHGKKIAEGLKKSLRNEALAEVSGRKRSPSANPSKSSSPTILTSEERFIAQQFGMSDEDYIKYKSQN